MSTPLATKPKMKLTTHQMEVLRIVIAGNVTPDPNLQLADLDEILTRVTKSTTKAAMQFTIRALVHNGMIEKAPRVSRRGRTRATFSPTAIGKAVGSTGAASIVETDPDLDRSVEELLTGT